MHETAHGIELLIRLEDKEGVEVSCVIDYTSLVRALALLQRRLYHPLHGPRQYTKCHSFQYLVGSRTQVEGAWK